MSKAQLSAGAPTSSAGELERGRLPRLLAAVSASDTTLAAHLSCHGPFVSPTNRDDRLELLEEIRSAGLLGRGGAAFPTARKMAAVMNSRGTPFVVANGTEGEPASAKDKVLLARAPHLVLDGAAIAAEIVGAKDVVVVAHSAVREIVDAALAERRRARSDRVSIRIAAAAPGFVAGEASAVVNWIEGREPVPRATPPQLAQRGVFRRPTLVNNVETLAHVALIARHGADWFRSVGTDDEPGSMLITVTGAVERQGVYEVAIGTSIEEVLALAGGETSPLRALLLGGYFGRWVRADEARSRPLSNAGLAPIGGGSGAGLVAALPVDACGLRETANVARFLAHESAGQCGPCRFGLPAVATEFGALAQGALFDLNRLDRWLRQVEGRGACSHPDGVVRLIRSALSVFHEEVVLHRRGWCTAPPRARSCVLLVPDEGVK